MAEAGQAHQGYKYVDLTSPEYQERFVSEGLVYRKTALVEAWQLVTATPVTTILASGTLETDRVAPAGHWVVRNPGGEMFALEPAKFAARYDPTGEHGVFRSKGRSLIIPNETGGWVQIDAPWKALQLGDDQCRFACVIESDGSLDPRDRYIIGLQELRDTYELEPESLIELARKGAKSSLAWLLDAERSFKDAERSLKLGGEPIRHSVARPGPRGKKEGGRAI